MKKFAIAPKRAVWIVVVGIVVAELLKRDYMTAGVVLGACFVGGYLLLSARRRLRWVFHWMKVDNRRRLLVISWLCMLYAWSAALFFKSSHPFFLLLALAIDYFLYDRPHQRLAKSPVSPESDAGSSSASSAPSAPTHKSSLDLSDDDA